MSFGTNPLGSIPLGAGAAVAVGAIIYSRTLSDSANATDQQQAYEDKLRLLFSNLDISDSLIRTLQLAGAAIERVLSSNINVNDLVSRDLILNRLLGSDVDVNDAIQSFVGTIISRLLSSNINLYDVINTQKEIERLLVESLILTDSILSDKELHRLLSDNLDLVDVIARTITLTPQSYNRILSDSAAIQDLILRETTGQIVALILSRLITPYNIIQGIEPMNIKLDSEDI